MHKAISFFALLFLTATNAFAATYYVAPAGSDAGPGTQESPWATIQHAAQVVVAGDTVLIRSGVYNEHVQPVNSGNLSQGYIVYSAYSGEQPIIDGTGVGTANNGFILNQKSYIKLLNLEVRNWNDNGMWIVASDHLEFSDCEVHDCGGGIGMASGTHDFELNRVKLHRFTMFGFDASPSGGPPCYNGVFNDCIAYTGRDREQNVDGFALGHGDQHDFTFNRCVVYDVFDGFDVSARNTTLNRCASYNNWNAGCKLWQDNIRLVNCLFYHTAGTNIYVAWSGTSKSVSLQNCTFVDGGNYNVWLENANDRLTMHNCIVAGGDNIGLSFEQLGVNGYSGDYNIFHNDNPNRTISVGYTDEFSLDQISAGAWTAYSGQDAHSLVSTDPNTQLFRSLSTWDLHLRESSMAIDKGTSQGAPSDDYDANPRPSGTGYDMGAYEYSPINPFNIVSIATDVTSPPAVGNAVHLSITASIPSNVSYRWYSGSGFDNQSLINWQPLEADWSTNNTVAWSPDGSNRYVVLAWVGDAANRTSRFQAGLIMETQGYSPNPIQITGMTSNMSFPQPRGTSVTLNTTAFGGNGTIYYKYFSRFENGSWNELGAWSPSGAATWTPMEDGLYTIVVHVSNDTTVPSNPLNQAGMIYTIGG